MFTDMGVDVDVPALDAAFRAWLRATMPAGDYVAWVGEAAPDDIAGGGGISLLRWPPGPRPVPGDRLAFVYNVYTEPAHRKRGLARSLMETIHAWCASQGIHALALNAGGRREAPVRVPRLCRRAEPDDVQSAVAGTAGAGETPGFPIGS